MDVEILCSGVGLYVCYLFWFFLFVFERKMSGGTNSKGHHHFFRLKQKCWDLSTPVQPSSEIITVFCRLMTSCHYSLRFSDFFRKSARTRGCTGGVPGFGSPDEAASFGIFH